MNVRRLLGSLLATAVAGTGAVVAVGAAPADAATTYQTRIVSGSSGRPVIYDSSYKTQPGAAVYGDSLSMSINVQALVDGAWKDIYDGSLRVTRKIGRTASIVASTSDDAYLYASTPAVATATYSITYTGYTDQYTGDHYAPAALNGTVAVQRKLTVTGTSGRSAGMKGKVSPKFRGKIIVLKKHGRTWKKYKVVRVNRNSRYVTKLPAPRRGKYFWKLQINAGGGFTKTQTGIYYTRRL
jgi:hypothetical protein